MPDPELHADRDRESKRNHHREDVEAELIAVGGVVDSCADHGSDDARSGPGGQDPSENDGHGSNPEQVADVGGHRGKPAAVATEDEKGEAHEEPWNRSGVGKQGKCDDLQRKERNKRVGTTPAVG